MHSSEDECMHSKREKGKEKKRGHLSQYFTNTHLQTFQFMYLGKKKTTKQHAYLSLWFKVTEYRFLGTTKITEVFVLLTLNWVSFSYQFIFSNLSGREAQALILCASQDTPCPKSRSRYKLQIQELATSPSISVSVIRSVTTGQIHHIWWQSPPDPFTAFC